MFRDCRIVNFCGRDFARAQVSFDLLQFDRGLIALLFEFLQPLFQGRGRGVLRLEALVQLLLFLLCLRQLFFEPRFACGERRFFRH